MLYKKLIVSSLIALISVSAQAEDLKFSASNAEHLVSSCREAIGIFETRDQTKKLARISTSMSEHIRAGYCIGVIQQYLETADYCRGYITSWRPVAQVIAEADDFNLPSDAQTLLKVAACD